MVLNATLRPGVNTGLVGSKCHHFTSGRPTKMSQLERKRRNRIHELQAKESLAVGEAQALAYHMKTIAKRIN